jgi:tripartite-type tricarboxylate transporter receptor subunit TctC
VQSGKLRTLAVMSDQRLDGVFVNTPTLKERKIDLSIGVWRGLAVPKGTPADVVEVLKVAARKTAAEASYKDTLAKANLGEAYLEAAPFKTAIEGERESFKKVLSKLVIQK